MVSILISYVQSKAVYNEKLVFIPGVSNYYGCDRMHVIKEKETCDSITRTYKIALGYFKWKNRRIITDCNNLKVGRKVCVDFWLI